ncbi:hypothetical protein C8J56DRAFT_914683 [Mycena floridula]|nr:hypothetical protein C8J56DRAFT_914683 [Mycena floridula]
MVNFLYAATVTLVSMNVAFTVAAPFNPPQISALIARDNVAMLDNRDFADDLLARNVEYLDERDLEDLFVRDFDEPELATRSKIGNFFKKIGHGISKAAHAVADTVKNALPLAEQALPVAEKAMSMAKH